MTCRDCRLSVVPSGSLPRPLDAEHRAGYRAGYRSFVVSGSGRVSGAPGCISCPEPPERIPTPRGQAREGATPENALGADQRKRSAPLRKGVAPSLALSAWWSGRFRAAAVSIDLSISLSIDLSVRHHIADAVHLLLHLERDRGRSLVNEAVRVRRYVREHDRSLTKTRYQRAGSTSTAA